MALIFLDNWIKELEVVLNTTNNSTTTNNNKDDNKQNDNSKKVKKEKAPAPAPTAAVATELNINSLDLRVGIITSCVKHETADKLYCEEIDIGEQEVRLIASGLVNHYKLDEMQNRKVIVIANLAPRKLVGFKSHGMVLCAAKVQEDGSEKVEFVEVPPEVKPGDRIVGEGLAVIAALSSKQVDKQKAWETLSSGLRSDENGVAYWHNVKLVVEGTNNHCYAPSLTGAVLR